MIEGDSNNSNHNQTSDTEAQWLRHFLTDLTDGQHCENQAQAVYGDIPYYPVSRTPTWFPFCRAPDLQRGHTTAITSVRFPSVSVHEVELLDGL